MSNLVWIDLEMTGLNPEVDQIIEIATIVTDPNLNIIECGPNLVIGQSFQVMNSMDDWNTNQHHSSGLTKAVLESKNTYSIVEKATLNFLSKWVKPGLSPMCGNSVCQDRRFLVRYMPKLANFFHYRSLDVSSLKIAANLWYKNFEPFVKQLGNHRALDDIKESIAECEYYRSMMQRYDG